MGGFDFSSPWLTFPVFSQYYKVETMQFMLLLKDSKNPTKYISNVTKFCQIYVVMPSFAKNIKLCVSFAKFMELCQVSPKNEVMC